MAIGADFDADLALVGGASLKIVSAGAMNLDCCVLWVNSWLRHDLGEPFLQSTKFTLDSGRWQLDSRRGGGSVVRGAKLAGTRKGEALRLRVVSSIYLRQFRGVMSISTV